jgi:hypothetical protein
VNDGARNADPMNLFHDTDDVIEMFEGVEGHDFREDSVLKRIRKPVQIRDDVCVRPSPAINPNTAQLLLSSTPQIQPAHLPAF